MNVISWPTSAVIGLAFKVSVVAAGTTEPVLPELELAVLPEVELEAVVPELPVLEALEEFDDVPPELPLLELDDIEAPVVLPVLVFEDAVPELPLLMLVEREAPVVLLELEVLLPALEDDEPLPAGRAPQPTRMMAMTTGKNCLARAKNMDISSRGVFHVGDEGSRAPHIASCADLRRQSHAKGARLARAITCSALYARLEAPGETAVRDRRGGAGPARPDRPRRSRTTPP